jgi:hypothetical protein
MQFTVDTGLAVAGVVLAVVTIIMAAPPLLQMFYGRPRLEFAVDEFTDPDGKQLIIHIKNGSTKNRFLRKIGVEREIGDVIAYFDIQEQGTNRFVKKDVFALLHNAPTRESGLLARARPGFSVGIVVVHTREARTWIIDGGADDNIESCDYTPVIAPGDYTVFATIICGEQVHKIRRNFKVGMYREGNRLTGAAVAGKG